MLVQHCCYNRSLCTTTVVFLGEDALGFQKDYTIQPNVTPIKMFFDEFQPILKEFSKEPIAFLGGFFSGVFHLNLADDPVKSWLDDRASSSDANASSGSDSNHNGKGNKPQSITIE